jgi:hypothetical protein
MNRNTDVWLCHTTKKINGKQTVVSCHLQYHAEMCFETTGCATANSVGCFRINRWIEILQSNLLPLFEGEHVDYLLYYFS